MQKIKGLFHRWFKLDFHYVAKNSFWLVSNQVIGALSSLILTIVFAHFVSKDDFGTYKYIISIMGIISVFTLSGMNTSVIQAVARGFEGTYKRSIIVQLKWSIIPCVASLAVALYYTYFGNFTLAIPLFVVAFAAPLSSVANTFMALLMGKKQFKTYSIYSIITAIFYLVWMAGIVFLGGKSIALASGYVLVSLITSGLFYFVTNKKFPANDKNDESAIGYGKHLSLMNVLSGVAAQVDSILIFHLLGPANLAIYSFATNIPERIRVMFNFTGTLVLPSLANKTIDEAQASITRKIITMILIAAGVILVYIVAAPFIYKILFPQYMDSVIYSRIFSLSMFAIATNISLSTLFSQRLKGELYIFTTFNPIIRIVLLAVFIYFFGLWGAIVSRIIASTVNLLSSIYLVYRKKPRAFI
jgi:O-antigen/teichoic acid export membrane protein